MARTKKTEATTIETSEATTESKKEVIRTSWNAPTSTVPMNKMYVEIMLTERSLGTSPNNKELLTDYIASKNPDPVSRQEEIDAITPEDEEKKQTTIFPKGYFAVGENKYIDVLDACEGNSNLRKNGISDEDKANLVRLPYIYNYQLRGFMKDSCGLLSRGGAKYSSTMKAYKKVIDGNIFVSPRRIAWNIPEYAIDEDGNYVKVDPCNLPVLQRPLRIAGPTGERSAIASSEELPIGSSIKFCISYMNAKDRNTIIEWLDYGTTHGLGAWRNSGKGTFVWRMLKPDWTPYEEGEEEA